MQNKLKVTHKRIASADISKRNRENREIIDCSKPQVKQIKSIYQESYLLNFDDNDDEQNDGGAIVNVENLQILVDNNDSPSKQLNQLKDVRIKSGNPAIWLKRNQNSAKKSSESPDKEHDNKRNSYPNLHT